MADERNITAAAASDRPQQAAATPGSAGAPAPLRDALEALRARLLATTFKTLEEVAERCDPMFGARVARKDHPTAAGDGLLSVQYDGQTLFPGFQFDDQGQLRPQVRDIIAALQAAGLDGWQLWEWMASPTGWLDGAVPAELLESEPDLVRAAADEVAVELAAGRRAARSRKE